MPSSKKLADALRTVKGFNDDLAFIVIPGPFVIQGRSEGHLVLYATAQRDATGEAGVKGPLVFPPIVALAMGLGLKDGLTDKLHDHRIYHSADAVHLSPWETGIAAFFKHKLVQISDVELPNISGVHYRFERVPLDDTLKEANLDLARDLGQKRYTFKPATLPEVLRYRWLATFGGGAAGSPALSLEQGSQNKVRVRAHRFYLMLAYSLIHHRRLLGCTSGQSVAAVLVGDDGSILTWSLNTAYDNRCYHAEVNLLRAYLKTMNNGPLPGRGLYLYTTLQPCLMCAGFIKHLTQSGMNIEVLYGQPDTNISGRNTALKEGEDQFYVNTTVSFEVLAEEVDETRRKAVRVRDPDHWDEVKGYLPELLEQSFSGANTRSRLVYLKGSGGGEDVTVRSGDYQGPTLLQRAWFGLAVKLYKYADLDAESAEQLNDPTRQALRKLARHIKQLLVDLKLGGVYDAAITRVKRGVDLDAFLAPRLAKPTERVAPCDDDEITYFLDNCLEQIPEEDVVVGPLVDPEPALVSTPARPPPVPPRPQGSPAIANLISAPRSAPSPPMLTSSGRAEAEKKRPWPVESKESSKLQRVSSDEDVSTTKPAAQRFVLPPKASTDEELMSRGAPYVTWAVAQKHQNRNAKSRRGPKPKDYVYHRGRCPTIYTFGAALPDIRTLQQISEQEVTEFNRCPRCNPR